MGFIIKCIQSYCENKEKCRSCFKKRERRQPTDALEQMADLESQCTVTRTISLSSHQGSIVGSSLSGKRMFHIAMPSESQSDVLRAEVLQTEVAKALRTKSSQLRLYEKERCLGTLDVIQDVSSITVRQALLA